MTWNGEVQKLHSLQIYGRNKYRFEESPELEIEVLFSEPDLPPEAMVIQTSYNQIKKQCTVLRELFEALTNQLRVDGSVEIAVCFSVLRLAAGSDVDIQLVYDECDIPRIVIQDAEKLGCTEERLLALRHLNPMLIICSAIVQDSCEVVTVINEQLETLFRKINSQRDIEVHGRLSQVLPWIQRSSFSVTSMQPSHTYSHKWTDCLL